MRADPISAIHNLGPKIEGQLAQVGITTAAQLRAIGAHEAYRLLIQNGQQMHFMAYLVLVTALDGRPWQDCVGEEKAALRVRFDAIKAEPLVEGVLPAPLRRALAQIGIVNP